MRFWRVVWAAWLALMLAWMLACMPGLVAASGASGASGDATPADAAADLRAGRAFVAVVIDQRDPRLLASEAYADWHAYFRRFAASGRGALPVYKLSPKRALLQLPALGKRVRNATVFVDVRGRGLLHEGLVLEPQVYAIGRAFAETGEVAAEARNAGLELRMMKQ